MKYILSIASLFLLASCGGAGEKPTDNITFGQAWKYAWSLPAYWVWVVIALVGGIAVAYFLRKDYQKKQNWSGGHMGVLVVAVALILAAFLATPASIAANTTVEQAARGVYIR
jgi:hypothetical protein